MHPVAVFQGGKMDRFVMIEEQQFFKHYVPHFVYSGKIYVQGRLNNALPPRNLQKVCTYCITSVGPTDNFL